MKQKLLFLSLFFAALAMNAQYTVEDHDGNFITDGQVLEFGGLVPIDPNASYEFFVTNTSSGDIRMKIEFVSALNADGSLFELCFGLCYTGIEIGQSYPPNADYVGLAPGEQTLEGNHMANADPGNGTDILDYVFRFYQIDNNGDEIGEDLTVTYRYNPTLGLGDVNQLNVGVFSNPNSKVFTVEVEEDMVMKVYDLQGRLMKSERINIGRQQINMSDLSTQMYVLYFENNRGVSHTEKIIVN